MTLKTGFGIPVAKTENTYGNYLSGEGIIEYDVSKKNDGSLILRAYSKPSNLGLGTTLNSTANQTYGAGVVYSKSFNNLFKKKNKVKDSLKNSNKNKPETIRIDSAK